MVYGIWLTLQGLMLRLPGLLFQVYGWRALSGRLKFTVRRHKSDKDSLSWRGGRCGVYKEHRARQPRDQALEPAVHVPGTSS